MSLPEYLSAAVEAARAAGQMMRLQQGKVGYKEKGWADLVTETDVACQKKIAEILMGRFPDHAFVGEESIENGRFLTEKECGSLAPPEKPLTWIVDPIDGTTNFVHGVPWFGPSIGLARGNELLCGVVYFPMAEEMFTAVAGQGAFLNGKRLHASSVTDLEHALTSVAFPTKTEPDSPDYLAFNALIAECQAIRRVGSTAMNLSFLGAGRFDALSCQTAHAWDVAAGVLIAREAGAIITSPDGSPFDLAVGGVIGAATEPLYRQLLGAFTGDKNA